MLNLVVIALRAIHILAGVFWVGAAATYVFFVATAARSLGADGASFLRAFMGRQRFPLAMTVASALTIAAGAVLYWRDSGGLQWAWIVSGAGLGYTLGALAALGAALVGNRLLGPTSRKLSTLSAALGSQGPSAEQTATLDGLAARLRLAEHLNLALLLAALFSMATARYWWF